VAFHVGKALLLLGLATKPPMPSDSKVDPGIGYGEVSVVDKVYVFARFPADVNPVP
jgi:hypothetical protein